ncbi:MULTISPECIES: hypothetical protein [Chryseobacterium]|uniref:Major capsid protein n=2 Tax=Chryseobacterium TaxID=59732 RepID=A0A6N4X4L6_9FLAO|nr:MULTISPECIES: hypothetical protein [Chryseobacterium]RMZ58961.1 hypothetical protein D1632_15460 [Chryseobacterium nematophagum]CAA7195451.1 hypothetical protein CHRY9293_01648 [Chryseobacterium potabilaquae]
MAITDNFVTSLLPLIEKLSAEADFSKLLFEKTFLPTEFNKANTVVTGVKNGNVVPIITDEVDYESFPFVDANSCDTTECNLNTNYSGKKWELGLIECRIPICLRSFNDDFLIFWNDYKMINPTTEVTKKYLNTALIQFLTNKVKNNLNGAKWRVAYFGDKASTSDYFNGFNGFFIQAEANTSLVVPIAKNTAGTYSAQQMTGQEVYDTLVEMEEVRLEKDWSATGNEVIKMPEKMARKFASYLNSLKDKDCCDGMERINPENIQTKSYTKDNMAFHGVPIMPVREWDEIINKTSELNGGGGNNPRVQPNRILWSPKEILLVGTQQREDLDMFEIWYDRTDRKVYIEAGSYLGASISLNEYVYAA